jgi:hypothetical protein
MQKCGFALESEGVLKWQKMKRNKKMLNELNVGRLTDYPSAPSIFCNDKSEPAGPFCHEI